MTNFKWTVILWYCGECKTLVFKVSAPTKKDAIDKAYYKACKKYFACNANFELKDVRLLPVF